MKNKKYLAYETLGVAGSIDENVIKNLSKPAVNLY